MKITLSNIELEIETRYPTKGSDYDYDPSRPERRFYYTIFYDIKFIDKILGITNFELVATSEALDDILRGIRSACNGTSAFASVNNGLYTKSPTMPVIAAIGLFKDSAVESISITFLYSSAEYTISLSLDDIDTIEVLLVSP